MAQATSTKISNSHSTLPKNIVLIAPAKCKGCELCVVTCPRGCLELAQDHLNAKGFHPAVFNYEGRLGPCNGCGICFIVCPHQSIIGVKVLKKEAVQ